jgi:flagellar motor switch protein FliG
MFSENYSRQTANASAHTAVPEELTEGELAQLARSPEAKVRATVAARSATPLTSILRLLTDEAPAVRAGVARNQRADMPIEIFQDLASDKAHEVVSALISNPAVPDSIISKLARHRTKDYSAAARERLSRSKGRSGILGMVGLGSK